MKKLSVVVSCYNEELVLPHFYEVTHEILKKCKWDYELIFVNDGSVDSTYSILEEFAKQDKNVKVVSFSRNFGHEAAMIAGIDYASGDGIVCMDADLQHPPKCIPDIIQQFDKGYEVITMVRTKNAGAGIFKNISSRLFYKVINRLSPIRFEENASDFFAISSKAADVLRNNYRENVRYLRGYVQSIGFKKTTLEYEAAKREAGKSHYNFIKLVKFSVTTVCGFSDIPLKSGIYAGMFSALMGVILIIYSIINKIFFEVPSGYTTIIVALCFLFSLTLIVLGIIGEYISVLLQEIKNRPVYIVENVLNEEEKEEK